MSKMPYRKNAAVTARSPARVTSAAAATPITESPLLKPGSFAKFEMAWPKIEPLVKRMFTEGGISKSEWQDIFWHVHCMCVWDISQGILLQEKLVEIFHAYIAKEREFIFKEYHSENSIALLRAYVEAWNRFLFYYNYVPLPFGPLEKLHYSSSNGGGGLSAGMPKKKLQHDVESCIRETMIELWVEHIFSEISSRLVEGAMTLIDGERKCKQQAPILNSSAANLSSLCRRPSLQATATDSAAATMSMVSSNSYLIIGIKESCLYLGHYIRDRLFLYRVNYELVYIARTEAYYRLAGAAFLQEHGILPYMKWVEGRIGEEQERATTRGYLEGHSLSKILNALVNVLIVSVKELLVEQFPGLLAAGDIPMLSLLFSLLARVPPPLATAEEGASAEGGNGLSTSNFTSSSSNDLSGMVTAFREYFVHRGAKELKALELSSCSRSAVAPLAQGAPKSLLLSNLVADSEAYIEQLLRLFNDATNLISDAFGGDPRFLTARDMAFNKLINEKCGAYLCSAPSRGSKFEKMECSKVVTDEHHQLNINDNNNLRTKVEELMEEGGGDSSLGLKSASAQRAAGITRAYSGSSEGSSGGSRCAELFANYCDMLLRKGTTLSRGLTGDQIEAKLTNVILVLKYVQDRLLFIRLYKAHLTRRLLLDASVDLDREEQMVTRLREVGMPADALNSLARMFADLKVSETFNRQFREQTQGFQCNDSSSQLVSVKVLNSKAWSTATAGGSGGGGTVSSSALAMAAASKPDCLSAGAGAAIATPSVSLPLGIEETLLKVEAFYRAKHSGRSLIWHHQFSSGVITFHTDLGASYDLEATAYQAAVLLSWNDFCQEEDRDSPMESSSAAAILSLEALSLATQLPALELKRALWSLVFNPKLKTQLLLPANPDGAPLKHIRDITSRTTFKLNDKFALLGKNGRLLKRARVNLIGRLALGSFGAPSTSSSSNYANVWADEAEAEKEAIARLRAERADEALLKILKTRKVTDLQALFADATRLLSQALFVPSRALLAERLQWLLEHDSVRRDELNEALYHYV